MVCMETSTYVYTRQDIEEATKEAERRLLQKRISEEQSSLIRFYIEETLQSRCIWYSYDGLKTLVSMNNDFKVEVSFAPFQLQIIELSSRERVLVTITDASLDLILKLKNAVLDHAISVYQVQEKVA